MEAAEQQKESMRDILATCKKTISYAWRFQRKEFVLYAIFLTVSSVTVYLQFNSFANIINEVVAIQQNGGGTTSALITQSILLAVFFLIPSLLNNVENYYSTSLRNKLNTDINLHRIDVFSKLDIGTVEGSAFQNKVEFAQRWGIGSIGNVLFAIMRAFRDAVALIVSASILFVIDPVLVALAIAGGIPGYFTAKKYQVKLFRVHHEQTEESRIIDDRRGFFSNPRKLIEILLFDIKNVFKRELTIAYKKHVDEVLHVSKEKAWAEFWEELFNTACLLAAVGFMIYQALNGSMLIGAVFLAFATYRSFVGTTNNFFFSLSQIEEHTRYAIRWFDLFDTKPKIINKPDARKPQWERSPLIEVKNISFSYPETSVMVLKNISFTVEPGEKLAFVGLNGAGKTTLVKLIARVYDPTEGQILVDGVDLRDIDIDHWRARLGILFQDFSNFQMTVREAIAISRPNEPIDDERVRWAAEMSGAVDFIKDFPNKYNQLIWKGFQDGVELSKGQFQRMAVARIFYRDALISILDEPTAAIDAVAEEKIFEALEQKMQGKSVMLISHRFSTVKNADKIAVVEHGVVSEFGSHKELMAKDGRYAELYTMQASRYLEQ